MLKIYFRRSKKKCIRKFKTTEMKSPGKNLSVNLPWYLTPLKTRISAKRSSKNVKNTTTPTPTTSSNF